MELDKLKQWLDLAQQYQSQNFWNQIFSEKSSSSNPQTHMNPFTFSQEYSPKCDLFEAEGVLVAEIEIPGLKYADIRISLQEQTLIISGEFRTLQEKGSYFLKERANRKFKKEITLPFPILLTKSKSELTDGILTITMPYNQEDMEAVPISFESSPE